MERKCVNCGTVLARDNTGELCSPCQKKKPDQRIIYDDEIIDAEGYAAILGLESAEQLKRLARQGKLAPRIPGIKEWKWYKKDIDAWIKQKQKEEIETQNKAKKLAERAESKDFRKTALAIATNLRNCSNDVVLRAMSDTVGKKVYGREYALATDDAGRMNDPARIDEIELAEVNRSIALKILKDLPKKDFPELEGLTDWKDLPYDRINTNLLVRLETYF